MQDERSKLGGKITISSVHTQFAGLRAAGRVCTNTSGDAGMKKASTRLLEQETQTPSPFIRPRGGWASYRAPPADPPPLPNPHRQTFLAVEPVHALVVGRPSFPHQHRRQPPIPETHALRR